MTGSRRLRPHVKIPSRIRRHHVLLAAIFVGLVIHEANAVLRYFGFPKLDSIERMDDDERKAMRARVDKVRKNLSITLDFQRKTKEFAVTIRDHGMGQTPANMDKSLLSLGRTDKADKPYLIGVFGQGGSSAFSIAKYSVVIARREGSGPGRSNRQSKTTTT